MGMVWARRTGVIWRVLEDLFWPSPCYQYVPFPLKEEKGCKLLATEEITSPFPREGLSGAQGTDNFMLMLWITLFFFFKEEKEIPFLLCNQEIEDAYLQITNRLW